MPFTAKDRAQGIKGAAFIIDNENMRHGRRPS
jgi:hypothetical protein